MKTDSEKERALILEEIGLLFDKAWQLMILLPESDAIVDLAQVWEKINND